MTEKKVTKREKFEMLLALDAVNSNEMLKEFVNHEIEMLENKNKSKKPTETQRKNEDIKDIILENLNGRMTVSEIMKAIQDKVEIELSNQRVSALIRQLRLDGKVERIEDKRKAYFERV